MCCLCAVSVLIEAFEVSFEVSIGVMCCVVQAYVLQGRCQRIGVTGHRCHKVGVTC